MKFSRYCSRNNREQYLFLKAQEVEYNYLGCKEAKNWSGGNGRDDASAPAWKVGRRDL